jgi:hypothetical protein
MTERPTDEDDDWPEPIHTPEERERATKAFNATFDLRRKVLRYAYLALGLLVVVVIIVALTR